MKRRFQLRLRLLAECLGMAATSILILIGMAAFGESRATEKYSGRPDSSYSGPAKTEYVIPQPAPGLRAAR